MTQYSICLAHANDRAAPDDFVVVSSGMLLTLGICSVIGAPIASLAMRLLGPGGLFAFSAACMFVFALAIAARRLRHALPSSASTEPFRSVGNMTTPAVYEMDPRTEDEQEEEDEPAPTNHANGSPGS